MLRALGELRKSGVLPPTSSSQIPELGGLKLGEKAPPLTAINQEGKTVRLDDFQGQRRILAFISPGCSACSGTINALNTFLRKEDNQIVLVIGGPELELNRAYAIEHKAHMPILTPAPTFDRELYHVQATPFLFFLDELGVVRAQGVVNAYDHLQQMIHSAYSSATVRS